MLIQDLLGLSFTDEEVRPGAAQAGGRASTHAENATELALLSTILKWPHLLPGCVKGCDCAVDIYLPPGDTQLPLPRLRVCTAQVPAEAVAAGRTNWLVDGVSLGYWGPHAHVVCEECQKECSERHGSKCCLVRTGCSTTQHSLADMCTVAYASCTHHYASMALHASQQLAWCRCCCLVQCLGYPSEPVCRVSSNRSEVAACADSIMCCCRRCRTSRGAPRSGAGSCPSSHEVLPHPLPSVRLPSSSSRSSALPLLPVHTFYGLPMPSCNAAVLGCTNGAVVVACTRRHLCGAAAPLAVSTAAAGAVLAIDHPLQQVCE
jgi:hypothetical protein